MVKFRQQLIQYLPGLVVTFLILLILVFVIIGLLKFSFLLDSDSFQESWFTLIQDSYTQSIIFFSIKQALLSTILSLLVGIIYAKSISICPKWLRKPLLNLLMLIFILPAIALITGLIIIYGKEGIISQFYHLLHGNWSFSLYGMMGILMAHVYLNFPFVAKLSYEAIESISIEHKKLADQIGFTAWQRFKILEFPILKKVLLPISGLIFLLCFSSFAIVLTLGGNPKYTTLSVAIYQSIQNFDFQSTLLFSLLQILFSMTVILILKKWTFTKSESLKKPTSNYSYHEPRYLVSCYQGIFIILTMFILLPLLGIFYEGLSSFKPSYLNNTFIYSTATSIIIATISSTISLFFTLCILWSSCYSRYYHNKKLGFTLESSSTLIFILPSILIGAGLFLLFQSLMDQLIFKVLLMIIINALMSLPIIINSMEASVHDIFKQYILLSQSIQLNWRQFLYIVIIKGLKQKLKSAFAFAFILSMGDLSVILLFNSPDLQTLPSYIKNLLGAYRYNEASFVTLWLLLCCYIILLGLSRQNERN